MKRKFFETLWVGILATAMVLSFGGMAISGSKTVELNYCGQPEHSSYLTHMIAENGWDKEAGITSKLLYFDSGMAQMEALPAKQWVTGTTGSVPWLVGALRHGLYTIAIANEDSTSNAVMVRPDSPILNIKGANPAFPETYGSADAVRGKTILVTTVSSGHYALSTWLHRLGLKDADVIVKNMDQGQALAAFQSGIGDLVVLWAPHMFIGMDKGWKIVNKDAQIGAQITNVILADRSWADKHPDQVVKVLKGYFKAIDKMKAENTKLAKPFSDWLENWAGVELSPKYAALDIKGHVVYDLDQQLKFFDDSKGPSDVEKWFQGLADFFVEQGKFSKEEMDKAMNSGCITNKFLKLLAEESK